MAEEPAAKKLKTEEGAVATEASAEGSAPAAAEATSATAAVAAAPEPEAVEEDAPADSRPKLKDAVKFHTEDTTLNVAESTFGNILSPVTDGGLQYLLAGARGNVGISSGRYMFEAKIIQAVNVPVEGNHARQHSQPVLRIGVSTQESSLLIGVGTAECVCFDSDGFLHSGFAPRSKVAQGFGRGDVVALVVNLNEEGVNARTISLYKNGVLNGKPAPLPDSLKDKVLYPSMSFKNNTFIYNFGPEPLAPLPFKCRMWQDVATADCNVVKPVPPLKDGRYEIIFPVSLPNEGGYDWLDSFLESNPKYSEISARAVARWAERSGIFKARGERGSRDDLDFSSGLPSLDNGSVLNTLRNIVPLQNRHCVIMKLQDNLVQAERAEHSTRWSSANFKRVAVVAMGEPPASIKAKAKESLLVEKQRELDSMFHTKKMAWARRTSDAKAAAEKRKRDAAEKKALEAQQKAALEAQQKAAEDDAEKKAGEEKEDVGESGEGAEKAEKTESEPKAEEAKQEDAAAAEEAEDEDMEPEPTRETAVLSAEEEASAWYKKSRLPDLKEHVVDKHFVDFSLPQKSDGFEEVRFPWENAAACKARMEKFVTHKKLTARIDDLKPSSWFSDKMAAWQKALHSWQMKATEFRSKSQQQLSQTFQKEQAAKVEEEKTAKAQTDAEAPEDAVKTGEEAEAPSEKKAEAMEVDEEATKEEVKKVPDEKPKVDLNTLDVFGVENIMDIGDGRPLFCQFEYEDWTMMTLRFELHLLAHAFKHDVEDQDRNVMHSDNIQFYYKKYFNKHLNPQSFGHENVPALIAALPDTVRLMKEKRTLMSLLPDMESFGVFVMITEESRRERLRRINLGDETARLKVSRAMQYPVTRSHQATAAAAAHRRHGAMGHPHPGGHPGMARARGPAGAPRGPTPPGPLTHLGTALRNSGLGAPGVGVGQQGASSRQAMSLVNQLAGALRAHTPTPVGPVGTAGRFPPAQQRQGYIPGRLPGAPPVGYPGVHRSIPGAAPGGLRGGLPGGRPGGIPGGIPGGGLSRGLPQRGMPHGGLPHGGARGGMGGMRPMGGPAVGGMRAGSSMPHQPRR